MPAPRLVSLALILAGCSVGNITEDNYAEKAADIACRTLAKCERGYYESEYSDMADCRDEIQDDLEDLGEDLDDAGCDFDEGEAQECLDTLNTLTCEEYYEDVVQEGMHDDCRKVWDCD